jgi:hypothetical protein
VPRRSLDRQPERVLGAALSAQVRGELRDERRTLGRRQPDEQNATLGLEPPVSPKGRPQRLPLCMGEEVRPR